MKVTCTWGEGPDIILNLDGTQLILHETPVDYHRWTHGIVSEGSLDLTADEAIELGYRLINTGILAKELLISYIDYIIKEKG